MVKIGNGYINPAHVLAIGPERNGRGDVQIELGPGVFNIVTGLTVDEVHAKLFPPLAIPDADAGRKALELVASFDLGTPLSLHTIALARKALGRES